MSLLVTGGQVPVTEGAAGRPRTARWPRRSIVVRLWGGLAVFALLLLSAAGFIHNGVAQQDKSVDGLAQRLHPLQVANLEIRADFAQAQSALRAYLLTGEARFLSRYLLDEGSLNRALWQARELAADGELTGIVAESRAAGVWLGYAARMESQRPGSPALTRLTDQGSASARSFYQASDRLQARLQAEGQAAVYTGAQAVDHAVTVASVFATVAALLGLAAALAVIHGITGPLRATGCAPRRPRTPGCARWRGTPGCGSGSTCGWRTCCARPRTRSSPVSAPMSPTCTSSGTGCSACPSVTSTTGCFPPASSPSCRARATPCSATCSSATRASFIRTFPAPTVTGCRRRSGIHCARRGSSRR